MNKPLEKLYRQLPDGSFIRDVAPKWSIVDRPCAAPGLISYRCKCSYGWIMIGAKDHDDAMREALRSSPHVTRDGLQIWNGQEYQDAI